MPFIAPIAGYAARYVLMTLAFYLLLQARERLGHDQRTEDALDDLPEGAALRRDGDGWRGGFRLHRVVRAGANGPGVAVDFAGLARLRLRKV
ncbi:MAG: hypothetical protein KDA73_06405 [Rhodobacteraceae bacterium]|nr:hypothetical protein [Paracoccaceae bacterium]